MKGANFGASSSSFSSRPENRELNKTQPKTGFFLLLDSSSDFVMHRNNSKLLNFLWFQSSFVLYRLWVVKLSGLEGAPRAEGSAAEHRRRALCCLAAARIWPEKMRFCRRSGSVESASKYPWSFFAVLLFWARAKAVSPTGSGHLSAITFI